MPGGGALKHRFRAALLVAIFVLAVPAVALATHHGQRPRNFYRHGHHGPNGYEGAGAGTVTSFSDGTLTLALKGGGTITGSVTWGTHFQCQYAGHGNYRTVLAPA